MSAAAFSLRLWIKRAAFATVLRPAMWLVDRVDGARRSSAGLHPLPPRRLLVEVSGQRLSRFWQDGNYDSAGAHFLEIFTARFALQPHERVVEIGCGVGRIANALARHIKAPGSYAGFDVMPDAIEWCRQHLTPRHPHFTFEHSNVFNGKYNPNATVKSTEYRVPLPDSSVDFLFMTSVFTHLMPDECRHYLSEVSRLLKPGGRAFLTFFVIDDANRENVASRRGGLDFPYAHDGYRVHDDAVPEAAIAFERVHLDSWLAESNLRLQAFHPGQWRGGPGLTGQDALVVEVKT